MTRLPDFEDKAGQSLKVSYEEDSFWGKTTAIEMEGYSSGYGIHISYNTDSNAIGIADKVDGGFTNGEIIVDAAELLFKLGIQPEVLEAAAKKQLLSVVAINLVLAAADDLAQEWMEQDGSDMTELLQEKLTALMNAVIDARGTDEYWNK